MKALEELASHVFVQRLKAQTRWEQSVIVFNRIKSPTVNDRIGLLRKQETFERWTRWLNAIKKARI